MTILDEEREQFGKYNNFRRNLPGLKIGWSILTHSGLTISLKGFERESGIGLMRGKWDRYFRKYAWFKALTEPKLKLTDGPYLSLHHLWSTGYYHWVTEILLKLVLQSRSFENLTLILPQEIPRFALETIEPFSFKKIIYLPEKQVPLSKI